MEKLYNHLYEWYAVNHRTLPWRETQDGYRIWLSEVILQQTRVQQGIDYYLRFVARWPRVEDLAVAPEDDVLREWQGLGYYSRARNLHKAAQMIVERGWTPFPTRFEDIRQLPGVGDYTAGAIASFAYNLPFPAMDGNVYRVLARLLDIDEPFDTTSGKKLFRAKMDEFFDKNHPRLFNSAIMEFGALYCTPTLGDNCLSCTLRPYCLGYTNKTATLLPVRKQRTQVRDRWFDYHIYVLRKKQRTKEAESETEELFTLIRQRENPKDIWYHLYEFPCEELPSEKTTDHDTALSLTHVLSHQRIHARFILHKVDTLPQTADTLCVAWHELDHYALSRLTLKAIEKMGMKIG
ncbi:MAG: A/G-specific adenine glycosylase [Paludibacteraceae bacterium]|nr:A/G-specific adenine glycosylase [Paludibacteraceae bacterium]